MVKRKRDSTAAYAASQPLFAVLKDACDKLQQQSTNLATARDLVQNLHVKLDQVSLSVGDQEIGTVHHERYILSILQAWSAATESYRDIFEQLAILTAADPAEGKQASETHNSFKRTFEVASAANEAVSLIVRCREDARTASAEPNNHSNTNTDDKHGSGRPVKKSRSHLRSSGADSKHSAQAISENGVVYQDVSAEVAARLKAKEDKKQVIKEQKKRKRVSTESVDVKLSRRDQELPERPHKKKSKRKSSQPEGDENTTKDVSEHHKRKSRDHESVHKAHDNTESAKRRKKKSG